MAREVTFSGRDIIASLSILPIVNIPKNMTNLVERAKKVFYGQEGLPAIMYRLGLETQRVIQHQLDITARGQSSGKLRSSINVSQPIVSDDEVSIGIADSSQMPRYWIYQEFGIDPFDRNQRFMGGATGIVRVIPIRHPGFKGRFFILSGIRFIEDEGFSFIVNELKPLIDNLFNEE